MLHGTSNPFFQAHDTFGDGLKPLKRYGSSPVPSLTLSVSKLKIASMSEKLAEQESQLEKAALIGQDLLRQVELLQERVTELQTPESRHIACTEIQTFNPEIERNHSQDFMPTSPSTSRMLSKKRGLGAQASLLDSLDSPKSPYRAQRLSTASVCRVSRTPSPIERYFSNTLQKQSECESVLLKQNRLLRQQLEALREGKLSLEQEREGLLQQLHAANQATGRHKVAEKEAITRILELEQELQLLSGQLDGAHAQLERLGSSKFKGGALRDLGVEQLKAEKDEALAQLDLLRQRLDTALRDYKKQLHKLEIEKDQAAQRVQELETEAELLRQAIRTNDRNACQTPLSSEAHEPESKDRECNSRERQGDSSGRVKPSPFSIEDPELRALRNSLEDSHLQVEQLLREIEQLKLERQAESSVVLQESKGCTAAVDQRHSYSNTEPTESVSSSSEVPKLATNTNVDVGAFACPIPQSVAFGSQFTKLSKSGRKRMVRRVWINFFTNSVFWARSGVQAKCTSSRNVCHSATIKTFSLETKSLASGGGNEYWLKFKTEFPTRDLVCITESVDQAETWSNALKKHLNDRNLVLVL